MIPTVALNGSPLASANRALREKRIEEAIALYASASRRVPPELSKHIDFNLRFVSRSLRGTEKNPILVASTDFLPSVQPLENRDLTVIVLATSLTKAGKTARLLSRRANHRIGIIVLLTEPAETHVKDALEVLLSKLNLVTKFALITDEATFPCRDWLRQAHDGLKRRNVDVIHASTGTDTERYPGWCNAMAPPKLLREAVVTGHFTETIRVVEPSFLLTDTSRSVAVSSAGQGLHVVDTQRLHDSDDDALLSHREVCVVMPCLDPQAGTRRAQLLLDRGGMPADVIVAVDTLRQGFIPTLNQIARRSTAQRIVYLAEDAWPGDHWLRRAYDRMSSQDAKLLAFNCGKWHGRIAAFGMVDKAWAYELYGDQVLYEGYKSHRADNELTAIARAQHVYVYAPDCVLIERDEDKDFRTSEQAATNFHRSDARLFRDRFQNGFSGLATMNALEPLYDEYLDLRKHYGSRPQINFDTFEWYDSNEPVASPPQQPTIDPQEENHQDP